MKHIYLENPEKLKKIFNEVLGCEYFYDQNNNLTASRQLGIDRKSSFETLYYINKRHTEILYRTSPSNKHHKFGEYYFNKKGILKLMKFFDKYGNLISKTKYYKYYEIKEYSGNEKEITYYDEENIPFMKKHFTDNKLFKIEILNIANKSEKDLLIVAQHCLDRMIKRKEQKISDKTKNFS